MWLIPIIVLIVVAAANRDRGEVPVCLPNPRAAYFEPPAFVQAQGAVPSPILVLGDLALHGQPVPPAVVMCAIAEAEARGRSDIAGEIVRLFVVPVVHRHHTQERLRSFVAMPAPPPMIPERGRGERSASCFAASRASCDLRDDFREEEMRAALEQEDTRELVPVPMQRVKIAAVVGVDPARWDELAGRLAREAPTFASNRHVGQFRLRRDRLAELGIDPATVIGDLDAQRAALDADLSDACARLRDAGDLDAHVGRRILVPDVEEQIEVTLSGVLGVVQAAGLDGAIGWLESYGDRKRFPHTTAAFMRTNGVF